MNDEKVLVPFHASDLQFKTLVVFAPHPDDEIIGMGGTLLKAKEQGTKITLVYMTSGDKGGESKIRKKESTAVADKLGAEVVFLDYSDRGIKITEPTLQEVQSLLCENNYEAAFFPSPQEFHPDHRLTAALVWEAQKKIGFKGKLFHYEISRQSEVNTLVDITKEVDAKLDLLNLYESQLVQNNYVEVMEAMDVARTYTLPKEVKRAEGFYRYSDSQTELLQVLKERAFLGLNDPLPSDSPLISILIRTKNRHELLKRALASIARQTYSSDNIEVVVVNDGGEPVDSILVEFETQFFRLTKIDVPLSRGRAASANVALAAAQGQFVNFLDDDDELLPHHLMTFLAKWRRNREVEVFYRGVVALNEHAEEVQVFKDVYDRGRLLYMNYIPIHSVTFSRRFIDSGHRFDESFEFFEDWDFWIQLSRQSKFYFSDDITAIYHLVGDSAASEHMNPQIDPHFHVNKVRQKWMNKCTPNEWNASLNWIRTEAKKQ